MKKTMKSSKYLNALIEAGMVERHRGLVYVEKLYGVVSIEDSYREAQLVTESMEGEVLKGKWELKLL